MGRYIKPSIIFLLLLCIALACDGNGNNNTTTRTIGPEGGTIRSSDGRLTLIIPAGALDEDTEISIKRINRDELPSEFVEVLTERQYELGPDGLEFNVPIEVELRTDQDALDQDGNFSFDLSQIFTSSNGQIEALGNLETNINTDDSVTVKGTLDHFSVLVEERGSITVMIENVPKVIGLNIPFTVIVSVIVNPFSLITLTDALYTDLSIHDIFSVGELDFVAEIIPFSPEDIISIDMEVYKRTFDYICLGSEATTGIYAGQIDITGERIFPTDVGTFLFQIQEEVVLARSINCPADGPPPPTVPPPPPPSPSPSPPPPPVVPTFGALNIDGTWRFDCIVINEAFPLIVPNLGDPFTFDADLIVVPETLELMIFSFGNIFTLEGPLIPQPNGNFLFNGNGSGFLSENPGPNDANIQIEAENWIFSQDVPGSFSGDNQPGDIFADGVLRFNFPTLPLDNQSSTADCVGVKTGE